MPHPGSTVDILDMSIIIHYWVGLVNDNPYLDDLYKAGSIILIDEFSAAFELYSFIKVLTEQRETFRIWIIPIVITDIAIIVLHLKEVMQLR